MERPSKRPVNRVIDEELTTRQKARITIKMEERPFSQHVRRSD